MSAARDGRPARCTRALVTLCLRAHERIVSRGDPGSGRGQVVPAVSATEKALHDTTSGPSSGPNPASSIPPNIATSVALFDLCFVVL